MNRRVVRIVLSLFFCFVVALVAHIFLLVPAIAQSSIKVMPLGDSLTDGHTSPGSYRVDLINKGIPINFVGSQQNGPASLSDKDHEGHLGWYINDIKGSIVGWLNTYQPGYILLLIGTNDINRNDDVANAPSRLSSLLDTIINTSPNAYLLVGSIPPIADPSANARVIAYNSTIPGIVAQKQSQGKHIYFVNINSSINTSDLTDGVHINTTGYSKMATQWYSALAPLVAGVTPQLPTITPTAGPVTGQGMIITSPLELDRTSVVIGETISGTVTYKNDSTIPVTITEFIIAARPPGGSNLDGPYLDFSPATATITLQPGQSRTVTSSRTITSSDPTGQWYAFATYNDGVWHDAPSSQNKIFTVETISVPTHTPQTASPTPFPTTIPNAPSWFYQMPSNIRGFLEQLYLTLYVWKRDSNMAHLLEGLVGNSFPTNTPPQTSTIFPSSGCPTKNGYTCVFFDEFNGTTLNRVTTSNPNGKWFTRYIYDNGNLDRLNNELQRYRENDQTHLVSNGTLKLIARKVSTSDPNGINYESGMIRSNFSQRNGYFEARIKVPKGQGTWPAFWLNPQDQQWPPEIDIFEFFNRTASNTSIYNPYTSHHQTQPSSSQPAPSYSGPNTVADWTGNQAAYKPGYNFGDDFHIYAADWTSSEVKFYIDNIHILTRSYPWKHSNGTDGGPAHILLNVAIGDQGGQIDDTSLPQIMEIDYVRAYQKN